MSVDGRIGAAKEHDHREWAAVIVAGGAGRRLGGVDKPALEVGGRTLLDIAIEACADAVEIVVVGPERPTQRPVVWTRENPPGGGPLAGLAAGIDVLPAGTDLVVVLASDLPRVSADVVRRLVQAGSAAGEVDGAAVVDDSGHVQPLLACYRVDALVRALQRIGDPFGRPLRSLLAELQLATVPENDAAADIDTLDDLQNFTRPSHRQ